MCIIYNLILFNEFKDDTLHKHVKLLIHQSDECSLNVLDVDAKLLRITVPLIYNKNLKLLLMLHSEQGIYHMSGNYIMAKGITQLRRMRCQFLLYTILPTHSPSLRFDSLWYKCWPISLYQFLPSQSNWWLLQSSESRKMYWCMLVRYIKMLDHDLLLFKLELYDII